MPHEITVLPATWEELTFPPLLPNQLKVVLDLATPGDARLSWRSYIRRWYTRPKTATLPG